MKPSVAPRHFIVAISRKRSVTAIIMVLAATKRIAKNTAVPIARTRNPMFPHIVTKPAWKARSVSVLVGAVEFSNIASIDAASSAARDGSFTWRMNHPGESRPLLRSYMYS